MNSSVNIVSIGARTALGLKAPASAASYRAKVSGMTQHPFLIDRAGNLMQVALDRCLDPKIMGPERLILLAKTALLEACETLRGRWDKGISLPIYLGLPEIRPGFTKEDAQFIRDRLLRVEGLSIAISKVNTYTEGHAAGFSAFAAAADQIQQGVIEACLVGGVDSYFQPETMEWLDENRQLAGGEARSAFVPGEGAAFCLLLEASVTKRLELSAQARVRAVTTGTEPRLIKSSAVCLGEGLTKTIGKVVSSLRPPNETINNVICDINGESYRGEEWGFVCLRLAQYFNAPTAYWSPADCWGDTGAASAPLFAMLACQAIARGYAKGPRSLLWASSEGGLRGAAMLEAVSKNPAMGVDDV